MFCCKISEARCSLKDLALREVFLLCMWHRFIGALVWGCWSWVHADVVEEEEGDLTWCFLIFWDLSKYVCVIALNAAAWVSWWAAFKPVYCQAALPCFFSSRQSLFFESVNTFKIMDSFTPGRRVGVEVWTTRMLVFHSYCCKWICQLVCLSPPLTAPQFASQWNGWIAFSFPLFLKDGIRNRNHWEGCIYLVCHITALCSKFLM